MSKLDELIAELCPAGVEVKKLRDVATISRGGSFQKKDYVEAGFPCIHYGQIYTLYGLFVEKTTNYISDEQAAKQKKAVPNDVIMAVTSENIDDVCKSIAWLGDTEVAVSGHTAIIHHTLNPKYLVYFLHSSRFADQKVKMAHGTKVIEVRPDDLLDIDIPVPPIEVQREIVQILDNFTELTTELIAELTAELAARKVQYDYYSNAILDFSDARYYSLGELCEIVDYRGKTPVKSEEGVFLVTAKNIRQGYIDYEKSKEYIPANTYEEVMHRGLPRIGDVLITTEAPCGYVAQVDREDIALAQRVIKYRPKNSMQLDSTYLKFVLLGKEFQDKLEKAATGGTVKGIKGSTLHTMTIPIPDIKTQKKVVDTLSKLESLSYSISDRIPAEINARQKQYEYYLDSLLSFDKRGEE